MCIMQPPPPAPQPSLYSSYTSDSSKQASAQAMFSNQEPSYQLHPATREEIDFSSTAASSSQSSSKFDISNRSETKGFSSSHIEASASAAPATSTPAPAAAPVQPVVPQVPHSELRSLFALLFPRMCSQCTHCLLLGCCMGLRNLRVS